MDFGLTSGAEAPIEFKLDKVGIFWASFAAIWTVLLVGGIAFLIVKRDSQILRIRGIALSICAVLCLHCYWVSVQFGYIVGYAAPGDSEYWIMGTWLPFGIALFHASNSRFLHIAKAQKRFVMQESDRLSIYKPKPKGFLMRFRRMDYTSKIFTLVGAGMVFQIFVTIFVFIVSRKWHSSWGIPGTEAHGDTELERKMSMRKGWEWVFTVFWQFFWAWIVAPIILWKSRGIHDTQGWRVQTIGCCLASLHATPMWLIALYVPAMQPVNEYFVPPQWIAVSIMIMEMLTIFVPCWEVLRHQTLRQETLDSIVQWESKNRFPSHSGKSINSGSTTIDSVITGWKSTTSSYMSNSSESILTMGALEHVLERNPGPLLEFSALRDFSGENIAFLTSVSEWKLSLPPSVRNSVNSEKTESPVNKKELIRERFNRALRIYADYISSRDAEFQINLPSQTLKNLEATFEASARILYGDKRQLDLATPFATPEWEKPMTATSEANSEMGMIKPTSDAKVADMVCFWGEVPESFTETVFDEAEASIKYLVLTNTWPKFVRERRSSMDSNDSA